MEKIEVIIGGQIYWAYVEDLIALNNFNRK